MNRPRNKQPRADSGTKRGNERRHFQPRSAYPSNVPSFAQVKAGAQVSIVLKQDQSTGHEVQGVVQDVLTSGNHPRGIKVRLTDGRVGRVQRMVTQPSGAAGAVQSQGAHATLSNAAHDDYHQPPATQSLSAYITIKSKSARQAENNVQQKSVTAQCPICNDFEGDEIAVSRHVDEHLA
ncbi:hypothetical protein AMS68_002351 [Peltaster fructicola]|uniref:UBZ4-type domain-containing protein n=1 Tax=Peltaster fructicola TaxID=286661 RepID=A0A6H0XQ21_9PEZI|nr:hypothetical protein AMS68_002351 [Peltaster fructicola]